MSPFEYTFFTQTRLEPQEKMAAIKASVLATLPRTLASSRHYLIDRNLQICHECIAKRFYASSAVNVMNIFDRNTKRHQRNIAAKMPDHHVYDYLKDEVHLAYFRKMKCKMIGLLNC